MLVKGCTRDKAVAHWTDANTVLGGCVVVKLGRQNPLATDNARIVGNSDAMADAAKYKALLCCREYNETTDEGTRLCNVKDAPDNRRIGRHCDSCVTLVGAGHERHADDNSCVRCLESACRSRKL